MSPSPTSPDAAEQPTASEPAAGAPEGKPSRKEKTPKGKDAKEKEGKEPKPKSKGAPGSEKADKFVPDNPNFRYIVRVSDTDLDGRRRTVLALTGVKGVGIRIAESAVRMAGVDPNERIGNLPESAVETIEGTLASLPSRVPAWMTNHPHDYATGETFHYFGPDLETSRRDDVNQMKMIRSYRGVRHERGQKVRGQRTRSWRTPR